MRLKLGAPFSLTFLALVEPLQFYHLILINSLNKAIEENVKEIGQGTYKIEQVQWIGIGALKVVV